MAKSVRLASSSSCWNASPVWIFLKGYSFIYHWPPAYLRCLITLELPLWQQMERAALSLGSNLMSSKEGMNPVAKTLPLLISAMKMQAPSLLFAPP